jgi:hypothetical protein
MIHNCPHGIEGNEVIIAVDTKLWLRERVIIHGYTILMDLIWVNKWVIHLTSKPQYLVTNKQKTWPVLGEVHIVLHLATITSFTGSYQSKNGVTLHTSLVKSNNHQFAPVQEVSVWVSISFLPIVPITVSLGTNLPHESLDSFTNHFYITCIATSVPSMKVRVGLHKHIYLFLCSWYPQV